MKAGNLEFDSIRSFKLILVTIQKPQSVSRASISELGKEINPLSLFLSKNRPFLV